jgi:hypothetical protein
MTHATEHQIQAAFVQWLGTQRIPGLDTAHAIPNGGARHPAVGAKLKAEGVKAGALDWQWPSPRGGFTGLAIEFKAGDGVPSKEQRERIGALQRDGWCVVLCWDWTAAARTVLGYAALPRLEYV